MELAEALALRRKELGMKYEVLCEKSGIPVNTLKKIFTGNIAAPSFESIKSIAYAMDLTLEELDRRIEEKAEYSESDIAMLKAISALDAPGKAVMQAVLKAQQQRISEYGPAEKKSGVRKIPVIRADLDGTAEAIFFSKQEQIELQKEKNLTPDAP